MNKSLLSIATATVLLAGVGFAAAQAPTTTTTTTWTNEQGQTIREYSTTKKYESFNDPALRPTVGVVLPNGVTLYPLPETMKLQDADRYNYGMINGRPVIVDRSNRRVIHSWE
jgi:hypothetical protein